MELKVAIPQGSFIMQNLWSGANLNICKGWSLFGHQLYWPANKFTHLMYLQQVMIYFFYSEMYYNNYFTYLYYIWYVLLTFLDLIL